MCIHNHIWVSKCHIDWLIGCDNVALQWCFGVKTINAFHWFQISIFNFFIGNKKSKKPINEKYRFKI